MAAGEGNPEVGRVSIRVVPKVENFREKVEKELAGLKDQTIDIDPGMAGFRQKVQAATKGLKADVGLNLKTLPFRAAAKATAAAASGLDVAFDAVLEDTPLSRHARRAAKKASGHDVVFDSILRTRFVNSDTGFRNELPGLKKDLAFLRDYTKNITLAPFVRSTGEARLAFKPVVGASRTFSGIIKSIGKETDESTPQVVKFGRAMKRVTGGYKVERSMLQWFSDIRTLTDKGIGDPFRKSLSAMGESARITGHDMYVAGQAGVKPFRERLKQAGQQTDKARDRLRQFNLELENMKKYGRDGIDPAQDSASNSIDWIDDEVQGLRKLSEARKAFNRNKVGKGYDPKLHLEYQKLADSAKKLRGANPIEAFDQVKDITANLQKMQRKLGASGDSMEFVAAQLGAVENRHKRLQKSLKSRDMYLRHPEVKVLISGMEKADKATQKFKSSMQSARVALKKAQTASKGAFRNTGDIFNNSQLRNQLEYLGGGFSNLGKQVKKTKDRMGAFGITGITRKFEGATAPVKELGNSLQRLRYRLGGVAKDAISTDKVMGNLFKKSEKRAKKSNSGGGRRKILGLSRMTWLVGAVSALVAPLSGLVAGALGALPALGGAAVAALGVVVMGWDGIKDAASAAAPAVDRAKEALSGVFRDRMTPQFEQLGGVIDSVRGNLVGVAHGLSDFSQGFVDAASSTKGISNLQELLDNTGSMFSDMEPFANNFTGALLEMGAIGSRSFGKLSEGLNGWSEDFAESVTRMGEDGSLQDAIEGTFDIVGSLGTNIGKILGAGMRELPNIVESTTGMLDGLGDGLSDLMPVFGSFANGIFDVVGSLGSGLGDIGAAIAPSFDNIMEDLGGGISGLVDGIGDLGAELAPSVGALVEGITGPLGDIASNIGSSLSDAASTLSEHAPDLEENASRISDAFSDLVGGTGEGIFGGKPLVSESDAEALNELSDFAADVSEKFGQMTEGMGDTGSAWADWWDEWGLHRKEEAEEGINSAKSGVSEALSSYGNWFSRFMENGLKVNDLNHIAASEVGKINTFGVEIADAVRGISEEASRASEATSIDLTPQIEALDSATTMQEVREIQQEIMEIIRTGTGTGFGGSFSPKITITPEVELSQDLGMEQFGLLQQELIDSAKAMPPGEVTAKMNVKPEWTYEEGSVGAGVRDMMNRFAEAFQGEASAQVETSASTAGSNAKSAFQSSITGLSDPVEIEFQHASQSIDTSMDGMSNSISSGMANAKTTAQTESSGIGTTIVSALSGLPGRVGSIFSSMSGNMSGSVSGATSDVSGQMSGMSGSVTGSVGGMSGSVIGQMASMAGGMIGQIASAAGSVISSIAGMVVQSIGQIATLPGQAVAVLSGLGGVLVSSGVALVQGFINGITSMIGNVAAAASQVASAARAFFPFSPAKKGPFSGKGYTTHSGKALVKDFAKGMQSQTGAVEKAASAVAGATQKKFNSFSLDPQGYMEGFHRDAILQPVLESNAKKIRDHRDSQADSAERLAERIKKINESDSEQAKKEERIAEARKDAAEKTAEAKTDLRESLETPEYGDIDRSIQSYYIDGMKSALTKGLTDSMKDVDLAGRTREIALAAVSEARRVFGAHPLFDRVESSVTADHFADTLQRVIEESGIAEIPVNFAVSNLDQLKSDLDMSDGVASRALDLAVSTDPAATDSRYARQNREEVHYHVEDMEEAIRLEQQRERKEMTKIK